MQKLDFVRNLEIIVTRFQSEEIVSKFKGGFASPNVSYSYSTINSLLFISKSSYDQIKTDDRSYQILKSLNAEQIYTEINLSYLTSILQSTNTTAIVQNPIPIAFYNFHNTLLTTLKLAKDVLLSNVLESDFESSLNDGIIIFQILIEGEGLETEGYIKIFTALQELIETLNKILNETEERPEIILLDSDSDTNVGIKTGVETAKSLFSIFKEIWDFVTNFRFYKQAQKNKALLESLSIRAEIQKKVDENILTLEEGIQYTHMIKTRTDDLIGIKVLPKQIVMVTNQVENKKLLSDFEGTKLLSSGE